MREAAIPIVRLRGILIVSVQTELSDRLVLALKEDLAREVARSAPEGVVMEISGIDVFDSFIATAVRDLAQVASLLGVETVVAGLDPGMAITLVEMGMTMSGVRTALNLDTAFDYLEQRAVERAEQDARLLSELLGDELDETETSAEEESP